MTHNEYLGLRLLQRPLVELQRTSIEPCGTRFLVVVEAQPDMGELADLGVVLAPPQVDDVGDAEGPKLFDVLPTCDSASECQPLSHEKRFHRARPLPLFRVGLAFAVRLENI